jgi:hypothetical protein
VTSRRGFFATIAAACAARKVPFIGRREPLAVMESTAKGSADYLSDYIKQIAPTLTDSIFSESPVFYRLSRKGVEVRDSAGVSLISSPLQGERRDANS